MKKTKKGCTILLSIAVLLTATTPFVASAEETAAAAERQWACTLASDGTITATLWESSADSTTVKIQELFYTADNRICRDYYTDQFSVGAVLSDAEAQKGQYADRYTICTDTAGISYFGAKDAETFGYENGQLGDSKLSYEASKTLAAELLQTGSADKVTIYQRYFDLDKEYYPVTGTIYVNGEDLSTDDFTWLDADIQVSENKYGIALVVPHSLVSDDVTWTRIYGTMKSVLEQMPDVTNVMFQPYMYNAIVTDRAYSPCEVVQEAEANTKGDVDGDEEITISDAFETLLYNSKQSAGASDVMFTKSSGVLAEAGTFSAADIDHDGEITIQDAYRILMYSSYQSAGKEVDWEDVM